MRITTQVFSLPKAGNTPEEYEDACWPNRPLDLTAGAFRAAVADGATESSFAGLWAGMLVHSYCKGNLRVDSADSLQKTLKPLQTEWMKCINNRPYPWYVAEKLRMGAFAALVGLTVRPYGSGRSGGWWHAVASGDCCLFQIRRGHPIVSFPLDDSIHIDERPILISSNAANNEDLLGNTYREEGQWEPGDVFYLMSDALAFWFLRKIESGWCWPWHDLPGSGVFDRVNCESNDPTDSATFDRFISELRASGDLRNDDVTLLTLRVE